MKPDIRCCRHCLKKFTSWLDEAQCETCARQFLKNDALPLKFGFELECYALAFRETFIPCRTLLLESKIHVKTTSKKSFYFGLRISCEDSISGKCLEFITTPVASIYRVALFKYLTALVKIMLSEMKKLSLKSILIVQLSKLIEAVKKHREFSNIDALTIYYNVSIYLNREVYLKSDMTRHLQINFSFANVKDIRSPDPILTLVKCNSKLVSLLQSTFFQGGIHVQGKYIDFEKQGEAIMSQFEFRVTQLKLLFFNPELMRQHCVTRRFKYKVFWLILLYEMEQTALKHVRNLKELRHAPKDAAGVRYTLYNKTELNRDNYGPKDLIPLYIRSILGLFTEQEAVFFINKFPDYCKKHYDTHQLKKYLLALGSFLQEEMDMHPYNEWPKIHAELVLEARLPVRGADMACCESIIQALGDVKTTEGVSLAM